MKFPEKIRFGVVILLSLFFFIGCSKDDPSPDEDNDLGGRGGVTMTVDGQKLNFKFTTLMTEYQEAIEEGEEDFEVMMMASNVDFEDEGKVKNSENLYIGLTLPIEKFRNPKGTYNIGFEDNQPVQVLLYKNITNADNSLVVYASDGFGGDKDKSYGKLTITGYKIGKQDFGLEGFLPEEEDPGEGYTELTGSFEVVLHKAYESEENEDAPSTIELNASAYTFKQFSFNLFDFFL